MTEHEWTQMDPLQKQLNNEHVIHHDYPVALSTLQAWADGEGCVFQELDVLCSAPPSKAVAMAVA